MVFYTPKYKQKLQALINSDVISIPLNAGRTTQIKANNGFAFKNERSARVANIDVTNSNPVATAVPTPASGSAPLAVSFSAATSIDADNDTLTYIWQFGDGANATGVTAAHTYTAAGTYVALLTVTDGKNSVYATTTITAS